MRINFKRLHHVQITLPPGGEQQAREFYGRLLGLEEIPKPELLRASSGGLWFRIADVELHLGIEDLAGEPSPKRHPAFEVEDVSAVKEYLRERGVKLRDEKPLPGVARFSFFDPFGNRVELMGAGD